jgi:hypothetical protein
MSYNSLSTQIDALKSEMTSAISSTAMNAQDMIYMAKALGELGGLLGVNDIVAATAAKITELETKTSTSLASLETKRVNSLSDVNSDRATALADIESARVSAINQVSGAGASLHPFFTVGI